MDLESDVAKSIPRFGKVKRIISFHDMRGVPEDLEDIYKGMCDLDGDVVKIVVAAGQPSDNLRVLDLLKDAPKPTVALCMGDLGTCSRVLCGKLGAPFTYGAFNKERNIAPGILSHDELKNVYRFEEIGAQTGVFGVIGDPVAHSLSPLIHNRAFEKLGKNGVYIPFRVPRGELPGFLKDFDRVPLAGYSVTIPHKEAAARLMGPKDHAVETMGGRAASTALSFCRAS